MSPIKTRRKAALDNSVRTTPLTRSQKKMNSTNDTAATNWTESCTNNIVDDNAITNSTKLNSKQRTLRSTRSMSNNTINPTNISKDESTLNNDVFLSKTDSKKKKTESCREPQKKTCKNHKTPKSGVENGNVNQSPLNVTPKNMRISVNLTPTRSTKTPKKSPINTGSPKSHIKTPTGLTKTPRKLPIDNDLSISSEEMKIPVNELSNHQLLSDDRSNKKSKNITPTTKKPKIAGSLMKKLKSPRAELERSVSKSPKVVIREPKQIATKSPRRVPSKSPSRSPKKNSTNGKSSTLNKINSDAKLLIRSPYNSSSNSNDRNMLPVVMLEKLPAINKSSPSSKLSNRQFNSERKKSNTESSSEDDTSFILNVSESECQGSSKTGSEKEEPNPVNKSVLNSEEKLLRKPLKVSFADTKDTLLEKVKSVPLMSSTPRNPKSSLSPSEKIRNKQNHSIVSPLLNLEASRNNDLIADESAFLLCISDGYLSKSMNNTYEISDKSNTDEKKDGTYELKEPKTPNLREVIRKRKSVEAGLISDMHANKRVCRVRFTSPEQSINNITEPKLLLGRTTESSTNGSNINTPINSTSKLRTGRSNRKTVSFINSILKSDSKNNFKSKSSSLSSTNQKNTPINSKVSSPITRRPEFKSSVKKPPNFALIHQKKFEQMESLVDAKKRVVRRHLTLSTTKVSDLSAKNETKPLPICKKPLPTDNKNSGYNRFGFKVRKEDARKIITQKQHVPESSIKEQNKAIIKGVRTNRRFELLMAKRNM